MVPYRFRSFLYVNGDVAFFEKIVSFSVTRGAGKVKATKKARHPSDRPFKRFK